VLLAAGPGELLPQAAASSTVPADTTAIQAACRRLPRQDARAERADLAAGRLAVDRHAALADWLPALMMLICPGPPFVMIRGHSPSKPAARPGTAPNPG